MSWLRLTTVALLAAAVSGCFPDYQVEESSVHPGDMRTIAATNQSLAFSTNGENFSVRFDYDFAIDRYEVTVGRFQAWLDSGQDAPVPCESGTCSLEAGGPYATQMTWDSAWNARARQMNFRRFNDAGECYSPTPYGQKSTWELGQSPDEANLPMTCVSWFQAAAFCAWEGKRLPTDSEWVFAVTNSGRNLTAFPWGDTEPGCSRAIVNGCPFPADVGSASEGATAEGVEDMVGNVFEWVWNAQTNSPNELPVNGLNWAGPAAPLGSAAESILHNRHGGAYISPPSESVLRSDTVEAFVATDFYLDAGFRCARSL